MGKSGVALYKGFKGIVLIRKIWKLMVFEVFGNNVFNV